MNWLLMSAYLPLCVFLCATRGAYSRRLSLILTRTDFHVFGALPASAIKSNPLSWQCFILMWYLPFAQQYIPHTHTRTLKKCYNFCCCGGGFFSRWLHLVASSRPLAACHSDCHCYCCYYHNIMQRFRWFWLLYSVESPLNHAKTYFMHWSQC